MHFENSHKTKGPFKNDVTGGRGEVVSRIGGKGGEGVRTGGDVTTQKFFLNKKKMINAVCHYLAR